MPVASLGDEGSSCGVKLIAVKRICVVARRRWILLATSNVQRPCICDMCGGKKKAGPPCHVECSTAVASVLAMLNV